MKGSCKQSSNKQEICPICFENLIDAKLSSCSHRFCFQCIDKWTQKKANCPMCRRRVIWIRNERGKKKVQRRRETSEFPPPLPIRSLVAEQENEMQIPMYPIYFYPPTQTLYTVYYMPTGYPFPVNSFSPSFWFS